jgi:hypothetical protein
LGPSISSAFNSSISTPGAMCIEASIDIYSLSYSLFCRA